MTQAQESRLGRVIVDGEEATLVFERLLSHTIDEVWKSITDPSQLSKWYLPSSKVDGRVGGTVEFSGPQAHVTGKILVWDPPRVFEHEWRVDRPGLSNVGYGIVRWELSSTLDGTVLNLSHRLLSKQTVANFAPGVHAILDRLEAHLNGSNLPDWQKRQDEVRSSYRRPDM